VSISYPIGKLDGISPDIAAVFKSVGIRTTGKLLEAAKNPKGRKLLAEKTGFDEKRILRWANMADRMRLTGLGKEYAVLLRVVGVDTVRELKYRNPANLAKAMSEANKKRKLVRLLPSEQAVGRWIEQAKKLPLKITY
jgi:predicted flap endonuclease-1-like 5' DNA nuclease